jgi:hypothetical protein
MASSSSSDRSRSPGIRRWGPPSFVVPFVSPSANRDRPMMFHVP